MKRFLMALLLGSVSLLADGTVRQSINQLGTTNTWVLSYQWTGDASTGTVPITAAALNSCGCQGYLFSQVEVVPLSPAPTAGYSVAILDSGGADVLDGAAASLSASSPQAFAAAASATPLQGTFRLSISGQSVASARGTVFVFLSKPGTVNLATLGRGSGGSTSTANWLTLANPPFVDPRRYNFAPQTPGTTLSAGACSFPMSPLPPGVLAGSILYLSHGTGASENLKITAVSGSTVSGTCANGHSGAWDARSNSGGIGEALQIACATGPPVVIAPRSYTVYGTIPVPCGGLRFRGEGMFATVLNVNAGYTGRVIESIVGSVDMGDMEISYATTGVSGQAVYIEGASDGVVSGFYISNSLDGITGLDVARVYFRENTIFPARNGYTFGKKVGNSTPYVLGSIVGNSGVGNGVVLLPDIVGGIITHSGFSGGAAGISTVCSAGVINEMDVNNTIIDGITTLGIDLSVTGTCSAARWQMNNNKIAVFGQDIRVSSPAKPQIAALAILDNQMLTQSLNVSNVTIAGAQGVLVNGNLITSASGGGAGVSIGVVASDNVDVKVNNIGGDINWSSTPSSTNGIAVDGQAHTAINISANTIYSTGAQITSTSSNANSVTISQQQGGVTFANLPASAANGSQIFCTDCDATCSAGASAGRTCFRENGVWVR